MATEDTVTGDTSPADRSPGRIEALLASARGSDATAWRELLGDELRRKVYAACRPVAGLAVTVGSLAFGAAITGFPGRLDARRRPALGAVHHRPDSGWPPAAKHRYA